MRFRGEVEGGRTRRWRSGAPRRGLVRSIEPSAWTTKVEVESERSKEAVEKPQS
jgi:hypothetical protein